MERTKRYYLADFELSVDLFDSAQNAVGFPSYDFEVRFWTTSPTNAYTAYHRDGVCRNCTPTEDGQLLVKFDNHRLKCGALSMELTLFIPDASMPDGARRVCRLRRLPIDIVAYECEVPPEEAVTVTLPLIVAKSSDLEVISDAEIDALFGKSKNSTI